MKNLLIVSTLCALLAVPAFGWQDDTNATTDTTLYTPNHPSEILVGYSGGTQTIWIAGGQTTNDWVREGSWSGLPSGSVESDDILDATIAAADLATNAVTSANIDDKSIAAADLATNAVTSANINDGGIATADIADDAITSAKIGTVYQADTNATTTTTLYTPGFVGQMLFGSEGSTARVWIASGATTNDWSIKLISD